jgi:hypothetical protein
MATKKQKKKNELPPFKGGLYSDYYPIYMDGVEYGRNDCDELFVSMYEGAGIGRIALYMGFGYYMSDGVYLSPNGDMMDDEDSDDDSILDWLDDGEGVD